MSDPKDLHAEFYFSLGVVAGELLKPEAIEHLVDSLRRAALPRDYVRLVRDALTRALEEADEP